MTMSLKQKENELNFLKKRCNCNIYRERHCKIRVSFLLKNMEKGTGKRSLTKIVSTYLDTEKYIPASFEMRLQNTASRQGWAWG